MENDHLSDNVQDIFCGLPNLLIQTFNLGWKTKPMKGEYWPGNIYVDTIVRKRILYSLS